MDSTGQTLDVGGGCKACKEIFTVIFVKTEKKARFVTYFFPQNPVISCHNDVLPEKKIQMNDTAGA